MCITTQQFNRLVADNFADRLKQAFFFLFFFLKKSEKKPVLIQNKLIKIWETVELISTKVLTKDLINKYNILNGIFLQTAYKII